MDKPLVSVVVPVYNTARYLNQCVDSLTGQSLKDVEFIFVDDGSTDDSVEILRQYREKDGRIKILQQKNQYAGVARNHGMEEATGKYIIFLDSDDFFEPDMLGDTYRCAEKNQAEIVIFGYDEYDDRQQKSKKRKLITNNRFPRDCFKADDLGEDAFFMCKAAPWNKLFLMEFIEAHQFRFESLKKCNDTYFTFMAIATAERMVYIDKRYVHYRIENPNSLQGARNMSRRSFVDCGISTKKGLIETGKYCGTAKTSLIKYIHLLIAMGINPPYTKEELEQFYTYTKERLIPDLFDSPVDLTDGSAARDIYESEGFTDFLCRQLQKERTEKTEDYVSADSWEVRVGRALLTVPKGIIRRLKR